MACLGFVRKNVERVEKETFLDIVASRVVTIPEFQT